MYVRVNLDVVDLWVPLLFGPNPFDSWLFLLPCQLEMTVYYYIL